MAGPDGFFRVMECEGCGLRFTDPWPDHATLRKFYIQEYYGTQNFRFNSFIELFIYYFRMSRVNKILDFRRQGRILDVGVGRGLILHELKKKGWKVFGTEQTEKAACYSKNVLGMNIHVGGLEDIPLEEESLDVVTFWHVLEHLEDPFKALRKARQLLKPEGMLVVAVPNIQSLQARIFKGHWFHLDMPYHLFHFSDTWLIRHLEREGFGDIRVNHYSLEFNPFGFLQSLLNRMGFGFNLLYDTLKPGNLKKAFRESGLARRREIFSVLFLSLLLGPIALVVSTFFSALKMGGTVEITARKKPVFSVTSDE